jgi:hypothetical protein
MSISSTFFEQLLLLQIPKRQSSQQCRFALLGPMGIKAALRMLMKLTPDVDVMFELTCLSHEWPVGIIIGE